MNAMTMKAWMLAGVVTTGAGCTQSEVVGRLANSTARVFAPTDLSVHGFYEVPTEAARDGELQGGEARVAGLRYAMTAEANGEVEAEGFEADFPAPGEDALVRAAWGTWAQGVILVLPKDIDVSSLSTFPGDLADDTPVGTPRGIVIYVPSADAAAVAQGFHLGANVIGWTAEDEACYAQNNARFESEEPLYIACLERNDGCAGSDEENQDCEEACDEEVQAQLGEPVTCNGPRPMDTLEVVMTTAGEVRAKIEAGDAEPTTFLP